MSVKGKGYLFKKFLYQHSEIISSEVTHEIPYQDVTWTDLLEEFASFVRGCGFQPPKGELVWLEENEIVLTKAEAVLYGRSKEEEALDTD